MCLFLKDRFLITLPLCSEFKRKKGYYMTF